MKRAGFPRHAPEASLESLIELEDIGQEVLHPGGLQITADLASACEIVPGTRVLDVACGTGESACFLARQRRAEVTGVDRSGAMVLRARRKVADAEGRVAVLRADAHDLPFRSGSFDTAICECTLSLLDKERALAEMVRVVRAGGRIGFHEICWDEGAPEKLRQELVELEGERPETLRGWAELLTRFDVTGVRTVDLSSLIPEWMKQGRRELGVGGLSRVAHRAVRRWGFRGLWRILRSERIFRNEHLGYGMIVATKRMEGGHRA